MNALRHINEINNAIKKKKDFLAYKIQKHNIEYFKHRRTMTLVEKDGLCVI